MATQKLSIGNKKAGFEYELLEKYTAGMQLFGSEIKSIREGKASLVDSYCYFVRGEMYVKMHITEYHHGGYANHEPRRERKLLLTHRELIKLENKLKNQGLTLIPTCLFIDDRGWAKMDISLARGKREYDKRQDIRKKDDKRELDRVMKQ